MKKDYYFDENNFIDENDYIMILRFVNVLKSIRKFINDRSRLEIFKEIDLDMKIWMF